MNCIQQIANINNAGSTLIAEGEHCSAIESLTCALNILQDSISINPNSIMDDCAVATSEIESLEGAQFYTFNHALEFHPFPNSHCVRDEYDTNKSTGNCQYDVTFCSSILYYNLALAHHCLGNKYNGNSTVINMTASCILHKSIELYERSFQLANSIVLDSPHSEMLKSLMIATINNQASVYFSLNNCQEAGKKMKLLVDMSYSIDLDSDEEENIIIEEDLNQFLFNLILTNAPETAASA